MKKDDLTDIDMDFGEDLTHVDLPASPKKSTETKETKKPPKQVLDLAPDVPVPFVAVIGRKEITVGDLLALQPGEVMELNRLPSDGVDLVAGGRVIGKGELVDVEGRLGVRILKLLK